MDAGWRREELQKPYEPAVVRREWGAQVLAADILRPVVRKVNMLRDAGLTAEMVVAEFLQRRLAPLQAHERAFWECSGRDDEMRLEDRRLPLESFNQLMSRLFGTVWNTRIPAGAEPLYNQGAQRHRDRMPLFNEWGLVSEERGVMAEKVRSFPSSPDTEATSGCSGEEGITEGVYARQTAAAPEDCSSPNSMDGLFACDENVEIEVFRELEWDHSPRYLQLNLSSILFILCPCCCNF